VRQRHTRGVRTACARSRSLEIFWNPSRLRLALVMLYPAAVFVHMNRFIRAAVAIALGLLVASPVHAQEDDLTKLTLEDLLKVEVTSVSRKEQPLARTAAAVYVISEEDIRRSGARTIPDMLRMVPGFNVAQMDANGWAIGSRGFSAYYASKLLVLIDGRSVYTPLFAGVHWEMQNVLPSDIERIEVIRGPGGTVWGANAVNGVVNIITKAASATRGGLVKIVTSGERATEADARYGAALGSRVDFRVFGRALGRGSEAAGGIEDPDRANIELGGGRIDWRRADNETVSLYGFVQQGDVARVRMSPGGFVSDRGRFEQSNVVASWVKGHSARAETSVQAYYDVYNQGPTNEWKTADVDARHRQVIGRRHEIVFGGGIRVWENFATGYVPQREQVRLFSGFIQDEIELTRALFLTPGSKFEHNDYTGFEYQPSLRLLWQPTGRHVLWGSAARAVRTPSRSNKGVNVTFVAPLPDGTLLPASLVGNPDIESEKLVGYEAGYRLQLRTVSIDVTTFRNAYTDLQSAEPVAMQSPTLPLRFMMGNGIEAKTSGVEVMTQWMPWSPVRLAGSYSFLSIDATNAPGSRDFLSRTAENNSAPRHQVHARAYVDLPKRIEASALAWHIGALPGAVVDGYSRLDLRLGWRGYERLEIGAGVQNLLHGDTLEFADITGYSSLRRPATAFADIVWRF
jgi:iron complex outermembrane recepter protein